MIKVQGKISAIRKMGKTTFMDVGNTQVLFAADRFSFNINDIIQLDGESHVTKTGHNSVKLVNLLYHQKSNNHCPSAILNRYLIEKQDIINKIREFFKNKGFLDF